jgi:hypothetical protein
LYEADVEPLARAAELVVDPEILETHEIKRTGRRIA